MSKIQANREHVSMSVTTTNESITEPQHDVARAINASTRTTHRMLNKMIMDQLGHAILPRPAGVELYLWGLEPVRQVYGALESTLDALPCSLVQSLLSDICSVEIRRSARLQADLSNAGETAAPNDLTRRISSSLSTKPHLFLSYFHLFYLALFNGGRQIRQLLFNSNSAFRSHLSFWTFEAVGSPAEAFLPPSDPRHQDCLRHEESIKQRFKCRWNEAINRCCDQSAQDEIIAEANIAMDLLTRVVQNRIVLSHERPFI